MGIFVIDFETDSIEPRPEYPPRPVGAAIQEYGARAAKYLAWGHPTQNNISKRDAKRHLLSLWKNHTLIFHGAKFDLDVGREHLSLPFPSPDRYFCTLLEAFIYDPNMEKISLKPMAAELLEMPPDEQDELYQWIATHVPEAKRAIALAEKKGNKFPELGAWISKAPGKLVGKYANGDVRRTGKLHRLFMKHLDGEERTHYELERRLLLHLLEEERQGIPINAERLASEIKRGEGLLIKTDLWLRDRLKLPKGVELSQKQKVADAMEERGMVEEWILTDKGNRSTAADNLKQVCLDEVFLDVWSFRSILSTQLQTHAKPWLETAASTGKVFPSWNQVRQVNERQSGAVGARTGRLSCYQPSLMNVPVKPRPVVRSFQQWKRWEKTETPAYMVPLQGPIQLLNLRDFIEAPRGLRIFDRDYSQQELRILGHYEGKGLLQAYLRDPKLDVHSFAQKLINTRLSSSYARRPIKNTGFGIIYGIGVGLLAEKIETDTVTAGILKKAYLEVIPGIKDLIKELKTSAYHDEYMRTSGGRRFKCEPPKEIDGEMRSLEYKLINTLIQGSAADCTKRAMVNYFEHPEREGRLMLYVHDQLAGMCKTKAAKRQMRILQECMESVEFRIKMLTTGKIVQRWSEAK